MTTQVVWLAMETYLQTHDML